MTPKQSRFVDEYLVDLNATQAAIRAGYCPRTANEQSTRLLANVSIAAAVQTALSARSERVQITQDDVLRGLHHEATLAGEGSSHSARVSAWGLIGKHLGMFVERRQQLGEDGQPVNGQLFTHRFAANAVRLQLHALAYNLANFLRTLALPEAIKQWSLTTLRNRWSKSAPRSSAMGAPSVTRCRASAEPLSQQSRREFTDRRDD